MDRGCGVQPSYTCGGATTTKGLDNVKCGARCRKKCNSVRRIEATQYQRLNSFICNQCNSNAGDRERCFVCGKGFRLHHKRLICNVRSSPSHIACFQLSRNDRDKFKTGNRQCSSFSHRSVSSQPSQSFS